MRKKRNPPQDDNTLRLLSEEAETARRPSPLNATPIT